MKKLAPFLLLALGLPAQSQQEPGKGIDRHLQERWQKLGIKPRPAGDEEFLRRASLDLAGVIPTAAEAEKFFADRDPKKRAKKIDEYLASRAYAEHWSNVWTVLLVGWFQDPTEGYDREALREWLEDQLAKNVPWNRIAQSLLSATGTTVSNRASNFVARYLYGEGPDALTGRVAKSFLGYRIHCAQCHDHPFDAWSQNDFLALRSFFARSAAYGIQRETTVAAIRVTDLTSGDAPVPPKYLNGSAPVTELWRQDLALYVTRSKQFARSFVNRVWTHLVGRGIVHPPDQFSEKNPASHPELLEELAEDFIAKGYDIKRLIRVIANAKVYQLSSENAGIDPKLESEFVHAIPKPLTPWQLFQSIARITAYEKEYDRRKGQKTVDRSNFILQFYDALIEEPSNPNAYVETTQNLLTKLSQDYLANGGETLDAVAAAAPKRGADLAYLTVLGRLPTDEERKIVLRHLAAKSDDPAQGWRDVFYALINSHEFNFNH